MAALSEIQDIARKAAVAALHRTFSDVVVEPEVGPDGHELLRITLVTPLAIDDRDFVEALLSIKRSIREAGDERQALVGYATPAELADDGDTES